MANISISGRNSRSICIPVSEGARTPQEETAQLWLAGAAQMTWLVEQGYKKKH